MTPRIALLAAALIVAPLLKAQDAKVTELELKPSADATAPLVYAKNELTCKAGAKVKLTINNTGGAVPFPHNVVVTKIGADQKVVAASMAMMTDPKGMDKGYVPESADIIASTVFAQPGQSKSVEFIAPMDPGDYPVFCTFPGHATLMKTVIKVTP